MCGEVIRHKARWKGIEIYDKESKKSDSTNHGGFNGFYVIAVSG